MRDRKLGSVPVATVWLRIVLQGESPANRKLIILDPGSFASIGNLVGNANGTTGIRMTAENYIRKLFPVSEIHDIEDMTPRALTAQIGFHF